jgi:hypothetical protein
MALPDQEDFLLSYHTLKLMDFSVISVIIDHTDDDHARQLTGKQIFLAIFQSPSGYSKTITNESANSVFRITNL